MSTILLICYRCKTSEFELPFIFNDTSTDHCWGHSKKGLLRFLHPIHSLVVCMGWGEGRKPHQLVGVSSTAFNYLHNAEVIRPVHCICWSQCSGSMTFWCGSGSGFADPSIWLTDPDPDLLFSSLTFKIPTKNCFLKSFFAYYFWRYIYIIFQR